MDERSTFFLNGEDEEAYVGQMVENCSRFRKAVHWGPTEHISPEVENCSILRRAVHLGPTEYITTDTTVPELSQPMKIDLPIALLGMPVPIGMPQPMGLLDMLLSHPPQPTSHTRRICRVSSKGVSREPHPKAARLRKELRTSMIGNSTLSCFPFF